MIGGTFPQARIFQTYVASAYRGSGVGQRLVEEVIKRCERLAYLSIRADVAEDLEQANQFYRDLGFRTVRRKKGGEKSGRTLIVRVRELATPSLLDMAAFGSSAKVAPRIQVSTSTEAPLYLIDLNVLFDVTKRRVRASGGGRVFAAAADNSIKVALAEEFIAELERNTRDDLPDPTLELAKKLPRLPAPPVDVTQRLTAEFAPMLFPNRAKAGVLTTQDKSDILHLATAVHEGAKGFVTSEKAILAQAAYFSRQHELDVLSPVALGRDYVASAEGSEPVQLRFENRDLWCRSIAPSDLELVRRLAAVQEVPEPVIRSAVASGTSACPRRRIAVGAGEHLIAFASWDAPRPAVVERRVYFFVDSSDPVAELALEYLLASVIRDSAQDAPHVIYICPSPDDTLLRLKAIAFGFRPRSGTSSRTSKLEKICFGGVFTDDNWEKRRTALERATGVTLAAEPPAYRTASELVSIVSADRQQLCVSVGDLESLLSPVLFATGERPAVIVPIKPDYAEELFAGSSQRSLLHQSRALLLNEKRYFSNRRTYRKIPENGLIVFYESGSRGGRSAAIAIGRIRRRYLAGEATAAELAALSGVLSRRSVRDMAEGDEVCVTEFDNVARFKRVVPLSELKEMGCADAANLVTARPISPPGLKALLAKAVDHG